MSDGRTVRGRVPAQLAMATALRNQLSEPQRSGLSAVFGANPLGLHTRAVYNDAIGELLVGDALDNLGPSWDVLHAVPVGDDQPDVDHVVIGPAGAFTISSLNHSRQDVWVGGQTLLVAGQRTHSVRDAQYQAKRASALLTEAAERPVAVTALIVVVNPQKLTVREQPAGVVVLSSRQVVRWLARHERTLTGDEVALISDVADRSATWRTDPVPGLDTQQLHRDFSVLRGSVNTAGRRRAVWTAIGFVAVCAGIWFCVAGVVSALLGT